MTAEKMETKEAAVDTKDNSTSTRKEGKERSESASSSLAHKMYEDGRAREFFWGCQLTKENPTYEWNFTEEDDDQEFLQHTLFLRQACLGDGAKEGEVNLVELETTGSDGKELKYPILALTHGKLDMTLLKLNLTGEIPLTFKLTKGSGPVALSGQDLVEIPELEMEFMNTTTETETEEPESFGSGDEEVTKKVIKGKKRKASRSSKNKRKKRSRSSKSAEAEEEDDDDDDESMETDEEEESEEESEESEEESDEEEESPPKKKTSKKATAKATPKSTKAKAKAKAKGSAKKGKK